MTYKAEEAIKLAEKLGTNQVKLNERKTLSERLSTPLIACFVHIRGNMQEGKVFQKWVNIARKHANTLGGSTGEKFHQILDQLS